MGNSQLTNEEITIEQYKIYNDSINRINTSWSQTDKLFLSLLSGLLAGIVFLSKLDVPVYNESFVSFGVKLIGILTALLALYWYLSIVSYIKIRNKKFEVLESIEAHLPHKCFTEEFKIRERMYRNPALPNVDNFIPIFIFFLSLFIVFYPIAELF